MNTLKLQYEFRRHWLVIVTPGMGKAYTPSQSSFISAWILLTNLSSGFSHQNTVLHDNVKAMLILQFFQMCGSFGIGDLPQIGSGGTRMQHQPLPPYECSHQAIPASVRHVSHSCVPQLWLELVYSVLMASFKLLSIISWKKLLLQQNNGEVILE